MQVTAVKPELTYAFTTAPKLVEWEVYICGSCFYKFDELKGDMLLGVPPKSEFASLPARFACPFCRAPKSMFFPAHCIAWA